jgi:hypothetical protein
MAELKKAKYEKFAQSIAKGLNATQSYISAGYSSAGAAQSAERLLRNAEITKRILELRETIAEAVIAAEIGNRNARVQELQHRWELMRRVIEERGKHADFAEIPGGTTGLLVRDYKGKDAQQPIYRVDTGILAELRLHEKQAAQELGQWSEEKEPGAPAVGERFTGTLEELLVLYRRVQV